MCSKSKIGAELGSIPHSVRLAYSSGALNKSLSIDYDCNVRDIYTLLYLLTVERQSEKKKPGKWFW